MLRIVTRMMLLASLLFMPLGMSTGTAATAAHHPVSAASMQHCPDQPTGHSQKSGFHECAMACAASLPARDADVGDHALPPATAAAPLLIKRLRGLHPETSTPPPKSA